MKNSWWFLFYFSKTNYRRFQRFKKEKNLFINDEKLFKNGTERTKKNNNMKWKNEIFYNHLISHTFFFQILALFNLFIFNSNTSDWQWQARDEFRAQAKSCWLLWRWNKREENIFLVWLMMCGWIKQAKAKRWTKQLDKTIFISNKF